MEDIAKNEAHKNYSDYVKYMSTLSTASIVFIITFLRNEIPDKSYRWVVIASIICLLISIVGGVFLKTIQFILHSDDDIEFKKTYYSFFQKSIIISMICLLVGFLLGITAFGIFGVLSII